MTRNLHEIKRKLSQTWQDTVALISDYRHSSITYIYGVIWEPSPFDMKPPENDDCLHDQF